MATFGPSLRLHCSPDHLPPSPRYGQGHSTDVDVEEGRSIAYVRTHNHHADHHAGKIRVKPGSDVNTFYALLQSRARSYIQLYQTLQLVMARIVIRSSALMKLQYISAGLIDDRVTFLDVKRAVRLKRRLLKIAALPPFANDARAIAPLFVDDPRIPKLWSDLLPDALFAICQHFCALRFQLVPEGGTGITWLELLLDLELQFERPIVPVDWTQRIGTTPLDPAPVVRLLLANYRALLARIVRFLVPEHRAFLQTRSSPGNTAALSVGHCHLLARSQLLAQLGPSAIAHCCTCTSAIQP